MTIHIPVNGSSESGKVPVRRRRNTQGATTVAVSMTIPRELNQTIIRLSKQTGQSKSLIAAELMEKGLKSNG